MLQELGEWGTTLLVIAEFTLVLIVLLIIFLAAIPGRVRGRKR